MGKLNLQTRRCGAFVGAQNPFPKIRMPTQNSPRLESAGAVENPAVLVVDDEYGPRESIAFSLSGEFSVDTAERGRQALAKLREKAYAVVVLDIRMPEMDGIRTLEELRKIDPLVAVIMLTGYGTLLTAQQAMVAGANQYLRKPPDIPELLEAVRRQAAGTRLRRMQAQAAIDAQNLNVALKREIEQNAPQIWQARASVELVHDLNNPLTVVIGYSSLVAEEARRFARHDPEAGKRLIEFSTTVEKAAEYCRSLSENWRIASKKATEFTPVDLVQIALEVWQVIFFSNPAIQILGLKQAIVRGSKFELMRVMQNLLKNSLEAGATQVGVTFSRVEEKVAMTVKDNGAGMDSESVKKALRGGYSSKASGMGLGLNICRHFAGTHGASFALESALGNGAAVKLVFPPLPLG
jgi:signal transduction histidine kinase